MKELESNFILNSKENIELQIQKKQEIEYVLDGTIKPIKSHFIWELNKLTGEIKKADFKKNTVAAFSTQLCSEELVVKSDCIYIPALNIKNAIKKYKINHEQSDYYKKTSPMSLSDSFY